MKRNARLYNCACCYCQVFICSVCDRGNIYCNDCAPTARTISLRRAKKKHQATRQGRLKNAERQKRYRERKQKKVTDQGSAALDANDVLHTESNTQKEASPSEQNSKKLTIHCHFCQGECDVFLRRQFLRQLPRVRYRS